MAINLGIEICPEMHAVIKIGENSLKLSNPETFTQFDKNP